MKKVILYTMKGCSHCDDMKESLKKSKIKFIGRDIDKYKKEYDLFVEATGNEFIPAFMLLSVNEKNETSDVVLMVPDDDFEDINEAMVKVKQYLKQYHFTNLIFYFPNVVSANNFFFEIILI